MSNITANSTALDQINLTGGFPTSTDLAPSIIFTVVYLITAPIMVYRLLKAESRSLALIRPTIFLVVRIATFVLRAYMSKNTYTENELIGELILVSIGVIFLVEPVVSLWQKHIGSAMSKDERPKWVAKLSTLLRVGVIAGGATAIGGASAISSALKTGNTSTVKTLREASACIILAVVVIASLATALTHVSFGLDARGSLFLAAPILPLIVVSVYRVVQVFSTDPSAAVRSIAAFWVLDILFEFLAYISLLAIKINVLFPGEPKELSDVEMGKGKGANATVQPNTFPPQPNQVIPRAWPAPASSPPNNLIPTGWPTAPNQPSNRL